MDDLKFIVALIALALSIWNLIRVQKLDDKREYKDKHSLYKDCLEEAKSLLEKIEIELTPLESDRSTMIMRNSSFLSTKGAESGINAILDNIGKVSKVRECVNDIYRSLGLVASMSDKDAFDTCIKYSSELKEHYLVATENLNKARLETDQILQAEKSHEKTNA